MTIKEKVSNDIATLALKGDLVSESDTSKVKEKIHSLVSDNIRKVVLDLSGVEFINSSGLGTLISSLTTLKNSGGDLRLAGLGERVENLFVITKLVKVFDTYETVDRALSSFNSPAK
ncbi:MAG TPA: STAS domain-containing protein [Bacteroidota bacterium]|nr:STAS domain-containing protein [Bacteroidota bacterium]